MRFFSSPIELIMVVLMGLGLGVSGVSFLFSAFTDGASLHHMIADGILTLIILNFAGIWAILKAINEAKSNPAEKEVTSPAEDIS